MRCKFHPSAEQRSDWRVNPRTQEWTRAPRASWWKSPSMILRPPGMGKNSSIWICVIVTKEGMVSAGIDCDTAMVTVATTRRCWTEM